MHHFMSDTDCRQISDKNQREMKLPFTEFKYFEVCQVGEDSEMHLTMPDQLKVFVEDDYTQFYRKTEGRFLSKLIWRTKIRL